MLAFRGQCSRQAWAYCLHLQFTESVSVADRLLAHTAVRLRTHLKSLTLPKILRRLWQRRAIADEHLAPKRARHPDFALNPAGQCLPHFRSLHAHASLLAHSLLDRSTGSVSASTTFPAASVFFVSSAVQHVRLCRRRCILRCAGTAMHLGSAALPYKQGIAQPTALTVGGGAILLSAEGLSQRWSNEAGEESSMSTVCPLSPRIRLGA